MDLLDATPDDWLELYRRAAQNRSPSDGSGDTTNVTPQSWLPRSQRLPLSLAGPGFAAHEPWPSTPAAPVVPPPRDGPTAPPHPEGNGKSDRIPEGVPIWARSPTGNPFVAYRSCVRGGPGLTDQNLTVNALRNRGVPEADIAAAAGNPELMKQLINQNFGPGSARAPASEDALWSGRAPAAPVMLAPQDGPTAPPQPEGHGKGNRLPAGPPIWARPPTGNPFMAYPGGVRGVPGLTDQNLTVNALRMRGVPDADRHCPAAPATGPGNPHVII
jgi:hypothetical protein